MQEKYNVVGVVARTCFWNQTDPLECPLYCFMHSVNKHSLSAHCVLGTVRSSKETVVNETKKSLPS